MIQKNYTIVHNELELDDLISHIRRHDIIAYDTETTGLNVRNDLIIGASFSGKIGTGYYLPTMVWNKTEQRLDKLPYYDMLSQVVALLKGKKLVMQNASYDIRITYSNYGINLLDDLHADTILMKSIFEEEGEFSLKPVAILKQKELGLDVEKAANEEQLELWDNIKKNGGNTTKTNYELYKADMTVIGKYACSDSDLTLRLYYYWQKKLDEEDMNSFFYHDEVMKLYKNVTIPMEMKGIKLDIPKLIKTDQEITTDMETLEEEIQKELEPYTKKLKQTILDKHIKISNKSAVAKRLAEKRFPSLPKTKSGVASLSAKNLNSLTCSDPDQTFALKFLQDGTYDRMLEAELQTIQEELYKESKDTKYVVNIKSGDHLADIFCDKLGEEPLSRTKETKKPQMNDEFLAHLEKKYPAARLLRVWNKLQKIKSSYIDRFLREQEGGIWYPRFKQHGTISGRYSSDAQQLTRPFESADGIDYRVYKYTNMLRSFLVARPNMKFIIADQSALEVRVFSHVSGDPKLISIFNNEEDFYSKIAIDVMGLDGYSAKSTDSNFLKKKAPEMRAFVKAPTLAVPYGAESFQVSKMLGIEQEEAQAFIDSYLGTYEKLNDLILISHVEAKTKGYVKTEFGRVRHLPEAKRIYDKYKDDLLNPFHYNRNMRRYHHTKQEIKDLRREYKNQLNNSVNFKIQSSAASIMNRAGIAIMEEFKKRSLNAYIVCQIHDEYIVECHDSITDEVCKIVKDKMENTTRLSLPLVTNPNVADNFGEGHE
jgi:DNA polymerase I-like protein with 3'-5' exonuclease and polymerase domains